MSYQPTDPLDFRSDTITKPCETMRKVMAEADVGDDYYRDDPTVDALEQKAAELLGKETALLTPSGTQSNLIALLTHCPRGSACIMGDRSHSFTRELGGMAWIAGVQPIALPTQKDGALDLRAVESALAGFGILSAPRGLLMLENTIEGRALDQSKVEALVRRTRDVGLAAHLDGARLFNAATARNCSASDLTAPFDSVSVCLSKGLGAPIGSVLAGSEAFIEQARRHRQALGGGLRQAGIIAAAGLFALENNRDRLAEDHVRARQLADLLQSIDGVSVQPPQTNILFADVDAQRQCEVQNAMAAAGIRFSGTASRQRWVTHLGINAPSLERVAVVVRALGGAL